MAMEKALLVWRAGYERRHASVCRLGDFVERLRNALYLAWALSSTDEHSCSVPMMSWIIPVWRMSYERPRPLDPAGVATLWKRLPLSRCLGSVPCCHCSFYYTCYYCSCLLPAYPPTHPLPPEVPDNCWTTYYQHPADMLRTFYRHTPTFYPHALYLPTDLPACRPTA